MGRPRRRGFSFEVWPLPFPLDRRAIRRAVTGARGGFALESVAQHPRWGRFSYYGFGRPAVRGSGRFAAHDPFAALAERLHAARAPRASPPLPFIGGWLGFIGYECGAFTEPFPRRHAGLAGLPSALWWACDALLVHERPGDRWYVAGCDLPLPDRSKRPLTARLNALSKWAARASDGPPLYEPPPVRPCRVQPEMRPADHMARVRRAIEYINAGDVFQVNLAQRFRAPLCGSPAALYERLCAANPAPFAAWLAWDRDARGRPRTAILSSSPELFLELRGGHVITRPIKGTARRSGAPGADAAARRQLERSEKDRAELVMIVDLLRNDLGRVCEFGSVRVTALVETEEHPTVFHRVATIEGDLRGGQNAIDLLRAAFPGGSVTGAPKVRALQIIDELEPAPRGPYCGAIGWISPNGDMTLNLAIRTVVVRGNRLFFWTGGGIVADSDPQAEYDETLAKAEGMRRAIEGC